MMVVWRGLVTYLDQQLRAGKSVNIKKFGAFTFDIETDLPKIAYKTNDNLRDLMTVRAERKNIHHLK